MKVAILLSIARQVEGEQIFINVMKAHRDPEKLRQYLAENTLPPTGVFQGVPCLIEYGVVPDVEVEES